MFKFLRARHRKLYISLALKYKVWPEHVYKLAHGKHTKKSKDRRIQHELLNQGIIHRHASESYDGSSDSDREDAKN